MRHMCNWQAVNWWETIYIKFYCIKMKQFFWLSITKIARTQLLYLVHSQFYHMLFIIVFTPWVKRTTQHCSTVFQHWTFIVGIDIALTTPWWKWSLYLSKSRKVALSIHDKNVYNFHISSTISLFWNKQEKLSFVTLK